MKKVLLIFASALLLYSCSNCTNSSQTTGADKQQAVLDNLMSRHSIRNYKPDQVPKATIDTLLHYAIQAPSAQNKQPWEVRVVQNAEVLGKIKAINEKIFHNSPTVIVIAKDTANRYGDFDCGILSQNIMLAAEAMDLGTCALGGLGRLLNSPEAKDITAALNLPEGYEPIIALSLGYKNEVPAVKPRDEKKVQFVE